MRKLVFALVLVGALVSPATAMAADLANGSGQSCASGTGTWHFVNNQTGGVAAGTIQVIFNDGAITISVGAGKVTSSTQHFFVTTDVGATLTSASTNLPGKLVLSDFACGPSKKK